MTSESNSTTTGTPRAGTRASAARAPAKRTKASASAVLDDAEPTVASINTSDLAADVVEVQFGAVGRVQTNDLSVVNGAVGGVRAKQVSIERGALGGALAGEIHVKQGFVQSVVARAAHFEQAFVRNLVAADVRFERSGFVGILLARRVSGDVRVLLDWRGGLAFGAAAGLVAGLMRRARDRRG